MMQKIFRGSGGQCSAIGCNMRRVANAETEVNFFYFPKDPVRRAEWSIATRRKGWIPTDHSLLCNAHFISGRPSADKRHPDYIPSIFPFNENAIEGRKKRFSTFKKNNCKDSPQEPSTYRKQERNTRPSTSKSIISKKGKNTSIVLAEKSSLSEVTLLEERLVEYQDEDNEEPVIEDNNKKLTSAPKINNLNKDAAGTSDLVIKNGVHENHIDERTILKRRKLGSPSSSRSITKVNVPEDSFDREEIFGHYVASEMKTLKDNPLLYLQTKQSILEILTSANFELINPE